MKTIRILLAILCLVVLAACGATIKAEAQTKYGTFGGSYKLPEHYGK